MTVKNTQLTKQIPTREISRESKVFKKIQGEPYLAAVSCNGYQTLKGPEKASRSADNREMPGDIYMRFISRSFVRRRTSLSKQDQSIKARSKQGYKTDSEVWRLTTALQYAVLYTICGAYGSMSEMPGIGACPEISRAFRCARIPRILCRILSIFVEFRRNVRTFPAPAHALHRSCALSFAKGVRRLCARCGGVRRIE